MRTTQQTLAIIAALATGIAIGSPLFAAEAQAPSDTTKTPNMMGQGSGMMDGGGEMMGMMKQMSQMMETCNKMMQTAMTGDRAAGKPNEPLNRDVPAEPGK